MQETKEQPSVPVKLIVLSEISRDIAQILFGALVVGIYLTTKDIGKIAFGLVLSMMFWLMSFFIVKERK